MNRLSSYIVVVLCFFLQSCHQHYSRELVVADSLADMQPDSALLILERFDTLSASKSDNMYCQLLRVKVNDKLDELDATVEEAEGMINFFDEIGDENLLPVAYYYGGRICAERNNIPQALDYFHKAERLLDAKNANRALLSKVYSQMGYLFVYRNMFDEARACSEKSYEIDRAIGDTIGMIYNLRDIGISHKWADREQAAFPYFYQARKLAAASQNRELQRNIDIQLSSTYLDVNELDSARKYGLPLLVGITKSDSVAVLSILSEIHFKSSQIDSAEHYLNLMRDCNRIDGRCYAYQRLTEINIMKNRPSIALTQYKNYVDLKYMEDKQNSTEVIAQANSAYNYQAKESENYELKIENGQQKTILVILISGSVVVVLFVSFFFMQYRGKQMSKLKELRKINEEQYRLSETALAVNRQRIKDLESRLQGADVANEDLRKKLECEKEKLESLLEMTILKKREGKRAVRAINNSEAYCRMLNLARNGKPQHITDEDWKELEDVFRREDNDFLVRLHELCQLSDFEYHVCLLLRAETDLQKMADVLMKALPTISTVRSRLYKKTFGKKGSAKDWDAVIAAL